MPDATLLSQTLPDLLNAGLTDILVGYPLKKCFEEHDTRDVVVVLLFLNGMECALIDYLAMQVRGEAPFRVFCTGVDLLLRKTFFT